MVFFLQRQIQPLQARVSKLWTYSGLSDPSRVSPTNPEKKDLENRVRSLTTLTAKMVVPACLAVPFDYTHPLPKVLDLQPKEIFHSPCNPGYPLLIICVCLVTGSSYPGFTSSPSRRRAHCCWSCSCWLWSPRGSRELGREWSQRFCGGKRLHSVTSLAESEDQGAGKKRKCPEDLTSSGSSKPKDVPQEQSTSKNPPASLFDFLEDDS
jgi:hypothetical protein